MYEHRREEYEANKIDTLEEAYDKIVQDRWVDIRTFHSDIYYIQHLINYQFNTKHSAKDINEMLYEEGLLKWDQYVPRRFIRKMEAINFKHVAATRPDYNQ